MLCDICHEKSATVHLTEIVNGKVTELHLCQECAQVKTEELKHQISLTDLLGGVFEKQTREEKKIFPCPGCGMTFAEFKKSGRLGCGQCYKAFKEQLLPLFRKIHGSIHHVGKFPLSMEKDQTLGRRLDELKERLRRAVMLEEYEEAARIRDRIKTLERERGQG